MLFLRFSFLIVLNFFTHSKIIFKRIIFNFLETNPESPFLCFAKVIRSKSIMRTYWFHQLASIIQKNSHKRIKIVIKCRIFLFWLEIFIHKGKISALKHNSIKMGASKTLFEISRMCRKLSKSKKFNRSEKSKQKVSVKRFFKNEHD